MDFNKEIHKDEDLEVTISSADTQSASPGKVWMHPNRVVCTPFAHKGLFGHPRSTTGDNRQQSTPRCVHAQRHGRSFVRALGMLRTGWDIQNTPRGKSSYWTAQRFWDRTRSDHWHWEYLATLPALVLPS